MPSLSYYRRIFSAYLLGGKSHLTFWHETPAENPHARATELGEYYMLFAEKADYRGAYDPSGIPQLDYHGHIGLQYNPIAIAQYGLGNYNLWRQTGDPTRKQKFLLIADWLCSNLEPNAQGFAVWNHHFNWEYRDTLRAPWYSALAQGQGISLLVRAYKETGVPKYLDAARRAFVSFQHSIPDGGVAFTDESGDLWFEEYIVSPPTHILTDSSGRSGESTITSSPLKTAPHRISSCAESELSFTISIASTSASGRSTSNPARACPWSRAPSITTCTSCSYASCIG